MAKKKEIQYSKVFYQRNIDLGIDPECHECTSHKGGKDGYPQVRVRGATENVHRHLYFQATGKRPEVVMHLCDNRRCINLNHLKAGTLVENYKDRISKGRTFDGERNPNASITEWEVHFIRGWLAEGYSQTVIAKAFKTTFDVIHGIKIGKTWKNVKPMNYLKEYKEE